MKYTPKALQNKYITPRIFNLFNDTVSNKKLLKLFFQQLLNVFEVQSNLENEEFFCEYLAIWNKINSYVLTLEYSNWRELIVFIVAHRK